MNGALARLARLAFVALLPLPGTPPPTAPPLRAGAAVIECAALTSYDFSALPEAPTRILSATLQPASEGFSEYCSVKGYVAPQVQFEIRLPTRDWNGKYFQAGCGGFCGSIPIGACDEALRRGYAVAAENSGHVGGITDALWALDSPALEIDWGFRSVHVVAVAAKAVIARFYGQPARFAYFQGCSTGGRQGLMEAQRFPDDFDGIIAGAPANRQNFLAPLAQAYLERVNRDATRRVILGTEKLPLISAAVYAACDGLDGLVDGQIDDPRQCPFNPEVLRCPDGLPGATCLSSAQVEVLHRFYDSPRDSRGNALYPGGLPRGSEVGWGLGNLVIGTDERLSGAGTFANQVLKYLAFRKDPPPDYDLYQFDFDTDPPRLREMAQVYNADDPNLAAFRGRGGRLILWHGWADPLITPYGTTAPSPTTRTLFARWEGVKPPAAGSGCSYSRGFTIVAAALAPTVWTG
ncbi:MAG: feruloyl esterase [Dehalococcoidia bacterium]|nr:MAG: feruloyl esterase [Dehalococcoidia bacterium]